MPSPESERVDALSEALARMVRRQALLDNRLALIETKLGITHVVEPLPETAPPARPAPPPSPAVAATPPADLPPPLPPGTPPAPAVTAPSLREQPPQLETRLGLKWINRIGVLTLALAVAFIFKYAVDNEWIGPAGRVALGVLAGLAALGAADRIWRGGQKTYAQGICGLGLAILYLSFYASFGLYHLLEPTPAFVLMVMTTALAGAVSLRYDSPAIAALGLLSGYATPLLLSTGEDRPWVLFSYVLLLNAGALAAARFRNWRSLEALAFSATIALYGGWMADRFTSEKRTVAALFGFLYYGVFAVSGIPAVFYAAQALASIAMAQIWAQMAGPYAASSLALVAAGLGISDWRNRAAGISVTFASFCLAYALWAGDYRFPQPVEPVFLFLTGAFLIFLGWIPWRILFRGAALTRQDALLLALNGAAYFGVCYDLLRKDYEAYLGLFAVALAAAHLVVAYLLWRNQPDERRDTRLILLSLGIALTFITLAAPIQFSGYRITMAWALELAALAWIAARTGSRGLKYATLAILLLLLARLDSVDAWMYASPSDYNPVANARFLTFLIAAVSLGAAAWWTRAGWEALTFYLGSHYVMLWGLGLEALGWAGRSASAENLRSAQSASVSILLACYAVLLIGAGVLYRSAVNRILGLSLIAIVVAKLYLYDVWLLVRIYRIAAFGALGALLLLTSYVSSRNRVAIENWWNERNRS
jgi:uncharacterized membrane protein